MFMLLNIISGFLETGAVIFCLGNLNAAAALTAALLYQIGNLVPFPVKLSKRATAGLSLAGAILMTAGFYYPVCVVAAVPLLSSALQSVRSSLKSDTNKAIKRSFRMLGFLLGFLFSPAFGIACGVILTLYAVFKATPQKTQITAPAFKTLQAVMILHQMHYFVYCYALMITAYRYGGAVLAAGLFFTGWAAYVIAPGLYKGGRNYRRMFLLGHAVLVTLLLTIFFAPSPYLQAFLWLLTGFGGTTEFCIGKLERQRGEYGDLNHNSAENAGHILGAAVCLGTFIITGDLYPTVLLSALFAACAMLLMKTVPIKGL